MNAHAQLRTFCAAAAAVALLACSAPAPEVEEAQAPTAPAAARSAAPAAPAAPAARRTREQRAAAPATGYQYIDESGRVRVAARLEDVPERQRATVQGLATARTARPVEPEAPESHARTVADVTIYTTPTCGYCSRAVAYLNKIGVDYVNKDVSADEEARDEYLALTRGRPGVPVIAVGDQWMQGWSQQHLDRLLAAAR